MKNIRIILIILIVILASSSIALSSNVIRIQTTTTTSGETGTFAIIMNNDISVNGLHFILQYEPNLITPIKIISVDRAGFLTGSIASLFGENKITFLVYDQGYNFLAADSGNIFEIEYIVSDSLTDSTKTQLVFTEAMAADSSIVMLPFEFIDGEISLAPSVGVKEPQNILPTKFELHQNYPNPFNPSTRIQFDLPQASFVTLMVYNILGQEVAMLVNEIKQPGTYTMQWNAPNYPSGVYICRMSAMNFHDVKKVILMK